MNIEVGKFYKTRDGRKARIYAVDGLSTFPVHGAILESEGWAEAAWTRRGDLLGYEVRPHFADLVSEWVEPRPRMLAWVSSCGVLYIGLHLPNEALGGWTRAPWLDEPEVTG